MSNFLSKFEIVKSALPMLLSVIAFVFSIYTYNKSLEKNIQERTPNLFLSSLIFDKDAFENNIFIEDVVSEPTPQTFLFLKMPHKTKDGTIVNDESFSLLINVIPTENNLPSESVIKFDIATLKNIGYDMKKFKLKDLKLTKDDGIELKINSGGDNSISKFVPYGRDFQISVSIFYNKDNLPFDINKVKNSEWAMRKVALTNGELLNSYFDDMADKIIKYELTLETTNKFNEVFEQSITINADIDKTHMYSASSSEPRYLRQDK